MLQHACCQAYKESKIQKKFCHKAQGKPIGGEISTRQNVKVGYKQDQVAFWWNQVTHYSLGHSTQGHILCLTPPSRAQGTWKKPPCSPNHPTSETTLALTPPTLESVSDWVPGQRDLPSMSQHLQAQTFMYTTQLYTVGERDFGALNPKQIVVNKSFLSRPRGV